MIATVSGAVVVIGCLGMLAIVGKMPSQQQGAVVEARTADGRPRLDGIWQALNHANWDIQDHSAEPGPPQFGALFAVPPGQGVVVGNEIPYRPEALAKRKEHFQKRLTEDIEAKCYLPGVPRFVYLPHPFQILQSTDHVMMASQYAAATRTIHLARSKEPAPLDTWMGRSYGHWEGDTLVVDVTGLNGQAWFDRSGNFASETMHIVERYTRTGPDHLLYEATIEDPNVFTRPWKISMPLYRRTEPGAKLLEFKCVPFSEELLYGHLRSRPSR